MEGYAEAYAAQRTFASLPPHQSRKTRAGQVPNVGLKRAKAAQKSLNHWLIKKKSSSLRLFPPDGVHRLTQPRKEHLDG
jgi:hypothetical protein